MTDPATLHTCQHHFCWTCIEHYYLDPSRQNTQLLCPVCSVPFWEKDCSKNLQLNNILESYRKLFSELIRPPELEIIFDPQFKIDVVEGHYDITGQKTETSQFERNEGEIMGSISTRELNFGNS